MSGGGAGRWFHTLVVVGASLSACGGRAERDGASPGDSGASDQSGGASNAGVGNSAAPRRPTDCAYDGAFTCASYVPLSGCYCNSAAPKSAADCPSPFAYRCVAYKDPTPPPPNTINLGPHYVACTCAESYPSPADCAAPEQFTCASIDHGYEGCSCDPSRPLSADQCKPPDSFCCQSDSPRFGCSCECIVIR